jgi:signal transduction histidine kinase
MAEMRRRLVGLREGTERAQEGVGDHTDAPGLGRLDQLARRVEAAGVSVDVRITGAPFALPPGVDLCVYRVIQEALTNVMKHAPTANASVTVHYDEAAVRVRVADDGQKPVLAGTTAGHAGHGLIGMRERAGVYGGTVTAGPGPQGGFVVALTVPVSRGR